MSRGDFWSRRRAAVEAEEAEAARARSDAEAEAEIDAERAALADKSDAEVLAELGLPEPESLVSGDDVRAFMARAVPQHLRRRALRKLWTTDPTFACLDGLVDYAADYTDAAAVTPNLRTAFRVGTGMIERLDALAPGGAGAQAAPAPEEAGAPEAPALEPAPGPAPQEAVAADPAALCSVEAAPAPEPEDAPSAETAPVRFAAPALIAPAPGQEPDEAVEVAPEPEDAPMPRRMAFQFVEEEP